MKKLLTLSAILVLMLALLCGCKCEHDWKDATCEDPELCSECEETKGSPLGHSWLAATCEEPKTCETCGETKGEAKGHNYASASCSAPETCKRCGETKGEALPHTLAAATCTRGESCSVCGVIQGEALGHSWVEADCESPRYCQTCGVSDGEALGHSWLEATIEAPMTCSVCGATQGEPLASIADLGMTNEEMEAFLNATLEQLGYHLNYLGLDSDGWPTYDILDSNDTYTNVFVAFEPNADNTKVFAVFVGGEDVSDNNCVVLVGAVGGIVLRGVSSEFDTELLQQTLSQEPEMEDGVGYYFVESAGIIADVQIYSEGLVFWVYPA